LFQVYVSTYAFTFLFINNNRYIVSLQLIGRSVGQLFRKEVKIDNLPRIEVLSKPQPVRVDEISKNAAETGIAALFAGST
jgi:hypothetical protein